MAKKKKSEPVPLSEKQREIMEVVWDCGEASVFEVREELAKKREVARNTIRTMMERLQDKGWLTHRVIGRTRFYSATITRKISLGKRVGEFVEKTCGGNPVDLMSALLEHRGLTKAEVERIESMLAEAKKKPKKGKRS